MRRGFKWLGLGAVVAVSAVAVAAGVGWVALTASLPPARGAAALPGLSAEVRIARDGHGIPLVTAATRADAVRALGFAHAQDRLWQMEVLRHAAQGRLSELFGAATVETDRYLRTLDIAGAAKASLERLDSDTRALLDAYAAGVNAWLEREGGLLGRVLPPEFLILGASPQAWQPWHSVALLKMMAVTLDGNLREEVQRLALAARGFSPAEIGDLLPLHPKDRAPDLPDLRTLYGWGPQGRPADPAPAAAQRTGSASPWPGGQLASNNWVVAGSRTESGAPLLANDPHLELTAPAIFYLARLRYGEGDGARRLEGATLPGVPAVLAGRTASLAWGLTTTGLDAQDLVLERVNPELPVEYATPAGWSEFEARQETITVAGGEPVRFERRQSRHGPVLPDGFMNIASLLPAGTVASLQWTVLAGDDTTLAGVLALNASRTVDEALAAARLIASPMQSVVMADASGEILVVAPARVPVRSPANTGAGRAPVPGWDESGAWSGWLPFERLPLIRNPSEGALSTANSHWLPDGYGEMLTHDWSEDWRERRARDLVVGRTSPHSAASMAEILDDTFALPMIQLRDLALRLLSPATFPDAELAAALAGWDGRMEGDQPIPLLLTALWRHLSSALFADDLGSEADRFGVLPIGIVLAALEQGRARDWCDDRGSQAAEGCEEMMRRALKAAWDEASASQGSDWRAWRWDRAHVARLVHRPFSQVGPLRPFFEITVPSEGSSHTLKRGRTDLSGPHPYDNRHASVFRAVYDFSPADRSGFVLASGQSGHLLSPHWRDQTELWARGDLLPMTAPAEETARTWLLRPAE